MKQFFPILGWLRNYKKDYISGDLVAGLTGGVMLIPQGMAYATLAGLPPQFGLYTAIFPQIVYSIFGTSRQLAVGPVAMDSLIVAAGLSAFATPESANYIGLAISLSFLMGIFQLLFGLMRLGFLTNFLSKPVISGFTSGAAVVIALSQIKSLLRIDVPSTYSTPHKIGIIIEHFADAHAITLIIGVMSLIVILAIRYTNKFIPAGLIVIIIGTYICASMRLDTFGVQIVGNIPSGFPKISFPDISAEKLTELSTMALSLALIGYLEAISIAKAIHEKHEGEYNLKNNQELAALGAGNLIGSFFSCYPSTGGFSRSAINAQSGARTNMTAVISALIVSITLMWLTPALYFLPKAVLSAIIMVSVFSLFDYKYPIFLLRTHREDFVMLIIAFLMTILLGIREGIITGVLASVLYVVYQSTRPHYAVLGRIKGTKAFRNAERFSNVDTREDVLIYRFDAALYFANINHFKNTLELEIKKKGRKLRLLILHMDSINTIDSTSLRQLQKLIKKLNENGIRVFISGLIGPIRDFLHRTGFVNEMGEDHFFLDAHTAIQHFDKETGREIGIHFKNAIQTNVFGKEKL